MVEKGVSQQDTGKTLNQIDVEIKTWENINQTLQQAETVQGIEDNCN